MVYIVGYTISKVRVLSNVHLLTLYMGASIVKWTKKVLRYIKIINFLVKGLKVVAKCCLN